MALRREMELSDQTKLATDPLARLRELGIELVFDGPIDQKALLEFQTKNPELMPYLLATIGLPGKTYET